MAKNAFNKRRELFSKRLSQKIKEEGNNHYSLERRVAWIGNLDIKKVRKR